MKAIKNFVDSTTFTPAFTPGQSKPAESKAELRALLQKPDTEWLLYSTLVGQTEGCRVSSTNPPAKILGLLADYEPDEPGSDCFDDRRLKRAKWTTRPTIVLPSQSGGVHAIWLFDTPLSVEPSYVKQALASIAKHLNLIGQRGGAKDLFSGRLRLDVTALEDYAKYYTWSGREPVLTGEVVESKPYALRIWEHVIQPRESVLKISLDKVQSALIEKYPELQDRPFELGGRTNIFWEGKENPTSGIIDNDGIFSFVDTTFYPWNHPGLLGEEKAKELAEGREADVISQVYFDGKFFYYQNRRGHWTHNSMEIFRTWLTNTHGIARADQARIIDEVNQTNRITGGAPLVHCRPGVHEIGESIVLNTSTLKLTPMQEGDPSAIIDWLKDSLVDREQFDWFCSWMASAYQSAVQKRVQQGPMVVIAGGTGAGKTFLATKVFGKLFGGSIDSTDIFFKQARFNSHAQAYYAWVADDPPPLTGPEHNAVGNILKRYVANRDHVFEAKGRPAVSVPWAGRIMITCNLDSESSFALPSLNASNKEKISFLRMRVPKQMPSEVEVLGALPAFAKYLYDWQIPADLKSVRFGVQAYHNPEVTEHSEVNSASTLALEFVRQLLKAMPERDYVGTTSEIVLAANQEFCDAGVLLPKSGNAAHWLGIQLGKLRDQGYPIRANRTNQGRKWTLPLSLLDATISVSKTIIR